MVKDLLEKLLVLQDLLESKFRLEYEMETLPSILLTKEQVEERVSNSVTILQEQKEKISSNLTGLRLNLSQLEQDRIRYETQISEIETQREYEALEKEIKNIFANEQTLRKDLTRYTSDFNHLEERLHREESLLQNQKEELAGERKRIAQEEVGKKTELATLEEKVLKISQGIDQEFLFKFRRIIRSKRGQGIVQLKGAVCGGCNMVLPEQFVNDVRKGDEVLFCPYCSKVLFYQESEDGGDQPWYSKEEGEVEGLIDLVENTTELPDDFEYYSTDDEDEGEEEELEEEPGEDKDDDFFDEDEESSIDVEEGTEEDSANNHG